MRLIVEVGVYIDFYNLHADAGFVFTLDSFDHCAHKILELKIVTRQHVRPTFSK
jgi:hypothetical protein